MVGMLHVLFAHGFGSGLCEEIIEVLLQGKDAMYLMEHGYAVGFCPIFEGKAAREAVLVWIGNSNESMLVWTKNMCQRESTSFIDADLRGNSLANSFSQEPFTYLASSLKVFGELKGNSG